jgi:hypothetical protein
MRNEENLRCYVCGSDKHLKRYCPKTMLAGIVNFLAIQRIIAQI